MILSGKDIKNLVECGWIEIEPYDPEMVSINSLDVRLGSDMATLCSMPYRARNLYSDELDGDWASVEPRPLAVLRKNCPICRHIPLPDDSEMFLLKSGRFYLGTTLERIHVKRIDWGQYATIQDWGRASQDQRVLSDLKGQAGEFQIVPQIQGNSTVGRFGLTVTRSASFGAVGHNGCWAVAVSVPRAGSVPLAVGTKIAQVVFHLSTNTEDAYTGVYKKGRFLPQPLTVKLPEMEKT